MVSLHIILISSRLPLYVSAVLCWLAQKIKIWNDFFEKKLEIVVLEESAYRMVSESTVDRTSAIRKIIDEIYVHSRENADIISSICTLFAELSHYG